MLSCPFYRWGRQTWRGDTWFQLAWLLSSRSCIWKSAVTSGSDSKESACKIGEPGSERFPGEGHGNPLQYSCLENPTDRGAWWAIVMVSQIVGHHWATNTDFYLCSLAPDCDTTWWLENGRGWNLLRQGSWSHRWNGRTWYHPPSILLYCWLPAGYPAQLGAVTVRGGLWFPSYILIFGREGGSGRKTNNLGQCKTRLGNDRWELGGGKERMELERLGNS